MNIFAHHTIARLCATQLWLKDNLLYLHLIKQSISLNSLVEWHYVFEHETVIIY